MFLKYFYDNMTQVALLLLFHHTVVLLPLRLFSTLVLTNRVHVLTNRVKAASPLQSCICVPLTIYRFELELRLCIPIPLL